MKKALVILAVTVLVASMCSTASANTVTRNVGTFVTRSDVYSTAGDAAGDPVGDFVSWGGFSDYPNTATGTAYAGDWDGGHAQSCETYVRYDRAELQALVNAAGSSPVATLLIPNRNSTSGTWNGNVVVGLFKFDSTDNGAPGAVNSLQQLWTADTTNNVPRPWKVDTNNTQFRAGGSAYANFQAMAVATGLVSTGLTGTYGRIDLNSVPTTDPTWSTALAPLGEKISVPMSLINAYLSDTSYEGLFFSVGGDGKIQGYGGNQWGGVGGPTILITPEPATMVLLALGGLALIRRRTA